jgi:RNA polymerase sigma-70 factor (ECF subfamily)
LKVREFERVVSESRDRLFGYALYFLARREEAEDVVQEVYMRLWQHRRDIDSSRIAGWLISVTRNLCRDHLRRRKVRSAVSVDSDAVEQMAGDEAATDTEAAASVFRETLDSALRNLPDTQKSIVVLREIQGMSYREIGIALDLPLTRVKVYLHRGRKALRNEISKVLQSEAVS